MREYPILHVFHIAGMRMIQAGVDGVLIGNNMGGGDEGN